MEDEGVHEGIDKVCNCAFKLATSSSKSAILFAFPAVVGLFVVFDTVGFSTFVVVGIYKSP